MDSYEKSLQTLELPAVLALLAAQAVGREYTDDCQLMEHAGFPVQLIEAEYTNLKITTPEDVAFAEAVLRQDENDG